jgi:lipopolysaccharide/colanic/teichoic acid biosynthesis glycosyltransferase
MKFPFLRVSGGSGENHNVLEIRYRGERGGTVAPQYPDQHALALGELGNAGFYDSSVLIHKGETPYASHGYEAAKRGFDILFAITMLIATIPVLLITAALIKFTSPGPVIFKQTRTGRGGRPFTMYKFRTMVSDADMRLSQNRQLHQDFHLNWKLRDDPRITEAGKWLRASSIDELPQLINVVIGQMSMVGPRPVQLPEAEQQYGRSITVAFCAKPGLTGLWQVSGRSRLSYDERVALDLEYARTRCLKTDALIVLKTIPAVLLRQDAH